MGTSNTIKCIAFDLGGVLVHVNRKALNRFNRPPIEIEDAFFGDGRHEALGIGEMDEKTYLMQVANRLGVDDLPALEHVWGQVVEWRSFAFELLQSIAVPFVFWTNTDPIHFRKLNRALQLSPERVEKCLLSHAGGVLKPHPDFFQRGLNKLKLPPQELLFVDDRIENVLSAQALGINAHQVDNEKELKTLLGSFQALS